MSERQIFHWFQGLGWLVFSGGADPYGEIRGKAIARGSADGAVVCIALTNEPNTADQLLDDVEDLGAQTGYIVDLNTEDDVTLQQRIGEAGVIVFYSDYAPEEIRSALLGAALSGIQTAYQNGAVILLEGTTAMAFGNLMYTRDGEIQQGLDWLENALIISPINNVAEYSRDFLSKNPAYFSIGIGVGSALALGPNNEVEVWGERKITVALGAAYQ